MQANNTNKVFAYVCTVTIVVVTCMVLVISSGKKEAPVVVTGFGVRESVVYSNTEFIQSNLTLSRVVLGEDLQKAIKEQRVGYVYDEESNVVRLFVFPNTESLHSLVPLR